MLKPLFKKYLTICTLTLGVASSILHFVSISHFFGRLSHASPATAGWMGALLAILSLMNLIGKQTWQPRAILVIEGLLLLMAAVCLMVNAVADWVAFLSCLVILGQVVISIVWY